MHAATWFRSNDEQTGPHRRRRGRHADDDQGILSKNGFDVVGEAQNGAEAVDKYKALTPDLVTMDMVMPEMDGITAVKQIIEPRSQCENHHVHVDGSAGAGRRGDSGRSEIVHHQAVPAAEDSGDHQQGADMSGQSLKLNELQKDALKEVGNIGAGHAATALSQLLNTKINLTEPRIDVIKFRDLATRVGHENRVIAALHMYVRGEAPGQMVVIFDREQALDFVNVSSSSASSATSRCSIRSSIRRSKSSATSLPARILRRSFS